MRAIIIKDVPGYRTGTSYSMSADLALHLISYGLAKAETQEAHTAALREIDKRLRNLRGSEPPVSQGVLGPEGVDMKPIPEKRDSQAKKRKKKK